MVSQAPTFSTIDREVVVTDSATGDVLWHGRPYEADVASLLAIPATADALVLLDYMSKRGAFANLIRIGPDGEIRWRAQLPSADSTDAYVEFDYDDDGDFVVAQSWTGHSVVIDPSSGKIIERKFVK